MKWISNDLWLLYFKGIIICLYYSGVAELPKPPPNSGSNASPPKIIPVTNTKTTQSKFLTQIHIIIISW